MMGWKVSKHVCILYILYSNSFEAWEVVSMSGVPYLSYLLMIFTVQPYASVSCQLMDSQPWRAIRHSATQPAENSAPKHRHRWRNTLQGKHQQCSVPAKASLNDPNFRRNLYVNVTSLPLGLTPWCSSRPYSNQSIPNSAAVFLASS